MQIARALRAALAMAGCGLSVPALSHIEYYDLNQGRQIADLTAAGKAIAGNDLPLSNPLYWNGTYQQFKTSGETWTALPGSYASGSWGYTLKVVNFDSSSWTDGLRTNPTGGANLLGNSHTVNFANFHLATASKISITLSDDLAATQYGLNPSFSLYRGSAVYQAHDSATSVDLLNPVSGSAKVQSAVDNGTRVDSQGITSPYRNTLTNTGLYAGQFNALGGWSMANPAGDWSAVEYVTSVTGYFNPSGNWVGSDNSNALLDYVLPAGDYIIAFGGNAQLPSYANPQSAKATSLYGPVSNLTAYLTFQAAPVPEPGTWMMMLAGLGLLGGVTRATRRRAR